MASGGVARQLVTIVPTRGRPENAKRLAEAFCATSSHVSRLYFVCDADDPELLSYAAVKVESSCSHVHMLTVDQRLRLGPTLNRVFTLLDSNYRHFGFMGDDHLPRTPAWDQYVIDALDEAELGVVYGDDLVHGEALPTAAFLTGPLVRTLGYMVPPALTHLYLDNFWRLIGERVHGLRYLPHVKIEHMHPLVGKAEEDSGYREVNSAEMWAHDQAAWDEYVATQLDQDIAKLLQRSALS